VPRSVYFRCLLTILVSSNMENLMTDQGVAVTFVT